MSLWSDFLPPIKRKVEKQAATASQSVFTLTVITYTVGADDLRVIINGRIQATDAYTETSSTQVTLSESLEGGELVEFEILRYV